MTMNSPASCETAEGGAPRNGLDGSEKEIAAGWNSELVRYVGVLLGALASIFTVSPPTLLAAGAHPQKNLLPYAEAQGTPVGYSRVIWLSERQVAFTSQKPGKSVRDWRHKEGDVTRLLRANSEEVLIFDAQTRTTVRHADGMLMSYENGVITIVLEQVLPDGYTRHGDKSGAYDIRLVGPLGREEKLTYPLANDPRPIAQCPGAPTTKRAATRTLKHEHGCLQHPGLYAPRDEPWLYYRSDGSIIHLALPRADVGTPIWVEWLGAYLLGDYVTMGEGLDGVSRQFLSLMKPDGRTLSVPVTEWSLTQARPTRAGMTAVRLVPRLPRGYDGIYLWQGQSVSQIAEGNIESPGGVEVSPDGCRLAYIWQPRGDRNLKEMRVIDVCRGLGVSAHANPFSW